jgi:hypothetical protein
MYGIYSLFGTQRMHRQRFVWVGDVHIDTRLLNFGGHEHGGHTWNNLFMV